MSVIEVLATSSSRSPDSRRLGCRAKRFKPPVGFGRQEKVALSQTLNLVRLELDLALSPGQIQIRMMALGLRDSPNLVRKRQRLREVLEGEEPLQMPFTVEFPASAELRQQVPRAESLQPRHSTSIATFLVGQFHRKLPSIILDGAFTSEEA